jgi:hypothetical protein
MHYSSIGEIGEKKLAPLDTQLTDDKWWRRQGAKHRVRKLPKQRVAPSAAKLVFCLLFSRKVGAMHN